MVTETLEQENHFAETAMSLYPDVRKNITMLGKNHRM
jgi:hypothetical protein